MNSVEKAGKTKEMEDEHFEPKHLPQEKLPSIFLVNIIGLQAGYSVLYFRVRAETREKGIKQVVLCGFL